MTRLIAPLLLTVVFAVTCTLLGALAGCTPGAWNPPKAGWVDPSTGCSRATHKVRGPDAYDAAHGRPYHCETPWYDPDNSDVDPVSQ